MTSSDRAPSSGERRQRRSFTAEQKADFVRRYDQAPQGSKGAFLRENNLYDSHIQKWRTSSTRPSRATDSTQKRLAELEAANAALNAELAASRRTVDTLGKAFALLEEVTKSAPKTPGPRGF